MNGKFNLFATTALSSTALLSFSGLAIAQKPVPFTWTGCYVGLNAGIASTRIKQRIVPPINPAIESSDRDTGFAGGGQVGCNLQYAPNWAFGVEGDINYVGARRSLNAAFASSEDSYGVMGRTRLRWLGTVRGRLGPTWGQSFLYATGGLAVGHVSSSFDVVINNNPPISASDSSTRTGWVVGAGFEHAFTSRISGKIEYLHFDLGRNSHSAMILGQTWTATNRVSGDRFLAGLNLRF
jgi:outer membrane immunogenic protein